MTRLLESKIYIKDISKRKLKEFIRLLQAQLKAPASLRALTSTPG